MQYQDITAASPPRPKPRGMSERKILAIVAAIIVVICAVGALSFLTFLNAMNQMPHNMGFDEFRVTTNSTDWKLTFVSGNRTDKPSDWYNISFIYITIFKSDGSVGIATKRVSDMAPGHSYDGVQFFDMQDHGFLDNGDYFTCDKSIYSSGCHVTVEGHGGMWSWSMSFGLQSWF